MSKVYIGIDVGAKGYAAINDDGVWAYIQLYERDWQDIFADLEMVVKDRGAENVFCVMEEVHAIFGSSAKATFSFGEVNGMLKMMLIALKIPYALVQPKEWQNEMWMRQDRVETHKKVEQKNGKVINKTEVNTKQTSYNCAKRLFPNLDFRRNERCKNWDDNKVDATLICEYGRRKNF